MKKNRTSNLRKSGKMRNYFASTRKMRGGVIQAPFIKFCHQNRERVKEELAERKGINVKDLRLGDTANELTRRWKAMNDAERSVYKSPTPSPRATSQSKHASTRSHSRSRKQK